MTMLESGHSGTPSPSDKTPPTRSRRLIIFLVVSLVNLALLGVLAYQVLTPAQKPVQSSPLIGHLAPDFTLAALGTQPTPAIHLAQWRGHIVVVNFWASWCDPCKHEAPLLQATWQQIKGQGVIFLGIDFGDTQKDGMAFLQHYGITYPNVGDSQGATAIDYGVTGVPETFFLDRRGVVVQKVTGELTKQSLISALQSLEHQP